MNINIEYVRMDNSEALNDYVRGKLQKISRKYEFVINADVHFEHEQDPKGKGCICKMELSLPGPRIFATANEKNYEMAVKHTIDELVKQLNKRKQVFKTH
ncbi:MAG: ribosome-associated translation inhibitor RaiA [Bacteroidia bacterium]|nr:ribosome-associated translation inhibitor RaiA [Bacteroidia bacterium]NNF81215.1 ribosome-associated translation inhibitor RaiA [Flavobacteriaceae bacterium]MBT8268978.1 ribosome-associated translation inhibitor RaiA [Bacteroidia bacterium]NNK69911.1 ribosome-associated translation inhibitor RaiA [Flavobacteriaceae bacterium]NNL80657.1 ribosome-associated translation inhibitor RaiA [Flavobacteriaceae bacterium]